MLVYGYPYNRSHIFKYVKYTKGINIYQKELQNSIRQIMFFLDQKSKTQQYNKTLKKNPCQNWN